MRAISLFSGVGGFERGFERAGIETVLQVELFDASHLSDARVGEPCETPEERHRGKSCEATADGKRRELTRYGGLLRGVLERHWPDVERVNDVRNVGADTVLDRATDEPDEPLEPPAGRRGADALGAGADGDRDGADRRGDPAGSAHLRGTGAVAGFGRQRVDLVYGGFPCQDLSVAGRRAGLGGERSGEWFEFHRVLRVLRPRWAVIENVPGLLSASGGWDFATLLCGLAGWLPVPPNGGWKNSGVIRGTEGFYHAAWTVLDAQHFGVPQRRRRVFVVAGPRGRGPEQVLSLCESCGGHHQASGAKRKDIAGTLGVGTARSGGATAGRNGLPHNLIANPLGSHHRRDDLDHDMYVASPITASAGHHGHSSPRGDGADNLVADTVRSHPRPGSNSVGGIAVDLQNAALTGELAGTIQSEGQRRGNRGQAVLSAPGVRCLTPRECERLMGWPDDWTRWTADGREVSDSQRYRMTGNGVVSTVAEWIGHRLVAVAS